MSPHPSDEELAHALRALPPVTPPRAAWTAILGRLARPERRWTRRVPQVAIALATLFAAFVIVTVDRHAPPPAAAGAELTAPAALTARSAALERALQALPAEQATRASTGYTAALLEDRIALVDERLSTRPGVALSPGAVDALWRERVRLLDSLVRVRYAASVGHSL